MYQGFIEEGLVSEKKLIVQVLGCGSLSKYGVKYTIEMEKFDEYFVNYPKISLFSFVKTTKNQISV